MSNAEMDSASPFAGTAHRPADTCRRGCARESSPPSISASASATRSAGMDLAESVGYLRHHLELAGRTDQLIADDAAARLHRYANGIPRALNNAARLRSWQPPLTGRDSSTTSARRRQSPS